MDYLYDETGCVFDTLFFLAEYYEFSVNKKENEAVINNPYYRTVIKILKENRGTLPNYLCPFFLFAGNSLSFMQYEVFEKNPYIKCTKDKVTAIFRNKYYLTRSYVDHFFTGIDGKTVKAKIGKHPDGIDIIAQHITNHSLGTYIYHSLIKFDEVVDELNALFSQVYLIFESEHKKFIDSNPGILQALAPDSPDERKLAAISGAEEMKNFMFSFTLMQPDNISFREEEPKFFLLGCNYQKVLETKYRYHDLSPYSFAEAIGNPTKYDIYRMLLKKSPLSREDLSELLHISRSAVEHNLTAMRERDLVTVAHTRGNAYYYRLNKEVIRLTAGMLLDNAGQ